MQNLIIPPLYNMHSARKKILLPRILYWPVHIKQIFYWPQIFPAPLFTKRHNKTQLFHGTAL